MQLFDIIKYSMTGSGISAINFVTPEQRRRGEDIAILAERKQVYLNAQPKNH